MSWVILDETAAAKSWDQYASSMPFSSPFQSFVAGQYAKQVGAPPYYCVNFDANGAVRAMALCTVRTRFWKAAVFACNGGPMGKVELWSGLPDALRKSAGLALVYLRFRCDDEHRDRDAEALVRTGWRRSSVTSGTSRTMTLDLSKSTDVIRSGLARPWSRDLGLSMKANLCLEDNASLNAVDMHRMLASLAANKQFSTAIGESHMQALLDHRGSNLVFTTASNAEGNVVSFRCTFILGNRAVDFIAASTSAGRKLRASFAVFWHSLLVLRERGVTDLDLGGIDPENNPGVYTFKARTGAIEKTMLGEFEIANAMAMIWIVNFALKARDLKSRIGNRLSPFQREKQD